MAQLWRALTKPLGSDSSISATVTRTLGRLLDERVPKVNSSLPSTSASMSMASTGTSALWIFSAVQIGRASCREREECSGWRRCMKRKEEGWWKIYERGVQE